MASTSLDDASPAAIVVTGLRKRYGDLVALDDLTLRVKRGETFGLLGPNGAGKSTLMKVLTGAARFDAGEVRVLDLPMPARSRAIRANTGLVPQEDNLDGELTCRQNLEVYARLYGVPAGERDDAVRRGLDLARLHDKADQLVEALSGGMRRRLLIARGLLHRPMLVLLDEPTVGLDPQIRQELWGVIDAVRATGATTVLTTHYIEEAERLCDRVAIVHHGRLLDLGTPQELIDRHVGTTDVIEVFGDDEVQRRVRGAASAAAVGVRGAGTSVAVFLDDVQELVDADGPAGLVSDDVHHRLRRPANLEDVFVTLTGEHL